MSDDITPIRTPSKAERPALAVSPKGPEDVGLIKGWYSVSVDPDAGKVRLYLDLDSTDGIQELSFDREDAIAIGLMMSGAAQALPPRVR